MALPVSSFHNANSLHNTHTQASYGTEVGEGVCVECLIGNKRNQFSLRSPSRVPYRTVTVQRSVRVKGSYVNIKVF